MLEWADASWANRIDLPSTGGKLPGLASISIMDGATVPVSIVYWQCKKLKCKCRSSLAAKVQEMASAEQDLYFARVRPAAEAGAQGRRGLYVKIGSQFHLPADVAPDANWAVACSGQDFAVWLAGGAGDSGRSL